MPNQGLLIGELSQRVNVSKQTIRYYERIGLINSPKRTQSGYRLYSSEDEERLQFIQKAKKFGLSLDEIKTLIDLRAKGILPCGSLKRMLQQHLEDLDNSIQEMTAFRKELASRYQEIESLLPNTKTGRICGFIEQENEV